MLRHLLVASAICVAVVACGGAAAASATPTVSGAWVRTPVPGATSTAAYFVIENPGAVAEVLTAVTSPAAGAASMHRTTTSTDMDRMTEMEAVAAIHIPGGGTVTLEPGGFHVMLEGLKGQLGDADVVALVLSFEHAGEVRVQAEVRGG